MTSILKVTEIQDPTNSNTAATIASDGTFSSTGHIIQVVSNSYSTSTSISSTTKGSGTSTGLTATITPKSTSNKLLLTGSITFGCGYLTDPALSIEIYDGSSVVHQGETWMFYGNGDGTEAYSFTMPIHAYIDAPSTSATTYTVRAYRGAAGNINAQDGSNISTLTIMEIAG